MKLIQTGASYATIDEFGKDTRWRIAAVETSTGSAIEVFREVPAAPGTVRIANRWDSVDIIDQSHEDAAFLLGKAMGVSDEQAEMILDSLLYEEEDSI